MTQDVFTTQTQDGTDVNAQPSGQVTPQASTQQGLFEALVGEDKDFKTADALAKAKLDSNEFIEFLKNQNEELRTELGNRLTSEQALENLKQQATASQKASDTTPAMTEDAIAKVVRNQITQIETERSVQDNVAIAQKQIIELANGDFTKASELVATRANELGVDTEYLRSIASESPSAFVSIIKGTMNTAPKHNSQTDVETSTVNTTAGAFNTNKAPDYGTKAYYDNMRKTNPKLYWDSKTQHEIFKHSKDGKYDGAK